jgi:DNA invertase Pin-like site-specific DNA recombinase
MQTDFNNGSLPTSLPELLMLVEKQSRRAEQEARNKIWAVYSRLSKFDSRQAGYSLEFQPDRSEEHARSLGAINIEKYEDPGKTGRNSQREGLQRLIRDIKAGKVYAVVVHRTDRLYRNQRSMLDFMHFLQANNVRLISVTEPYYDTSPMGLLVLHVMAMMNENYVLQTSAHTRESKVTRHRKGLPNGNLPIGYCKGLCQTCKDIHGEGLCPLYSQPDRTESQRGRMAIPHPVTRYLPPLVFEMYLAGNSFREIAHWLNTHEVTLPDGEKVRFTTRGKSEANPDRQFSREGIRAIIENPFFAGLVARYERPELNMEDDIEHPERARQSKQVNTRHIIELQEGVHEPLITVKMWKKAVQMRKMRSKTPINSTSNHRIYPLTGISRCWECYEYNGSIVTLRGTTINKKKRSYRCATLQDRHSMATVSELDTLPGKLRVNPTPVSQALLDRHQISYLPGDQLEGQVDVLMERLVIPDDWSDIIASYFVSEDGMTAYERESYNLRQSLDRQKILFKGGYIGIAELEEQTLFITKKLNELKPVNHPMVKELLPLMWDFPTIWHRMNDGEKRLILQTIFQGLYFDSRGRLRKVLAHPPFDKLLGLNDELSAE